jgi:GTP-binding protein
MTDTPEVQPAPEIQNPLEAGRLLFAGACDFIAGVTSLEIMPLPSLPEIAFIGRSNVGKSSLVNALTGRKTLARTSNTPGRTQQLNFFDLAHRLMLVDLPGYGYAKVSKKQAKDWNKLARQYLRGRVTLRRACLLIDARHGLKETDKGIMEVLDEAAVSYQIVLTKADKATGLELRAALEGAQKDIKKRAAALPDIITTSSEKNIGIAELRAALEQFAV